jgi:hypothetical protein
MCSGNWANVRYPTRGRAVQIVHRGAGHGPVVLDRGSGRPDRARQLGEHGSAAETAHRSAGDHLVVLDRARRSSIGPRPTIAGCNGVHSHGGYRPTHTLVAGMSAHIFVDESKHRGFLLAAAVVAPGELAGLRRQVSALRLSRQRRLHFTSESDARRKMILAAMIEAAGRCVAVYQVTGHHRDRDARDIAMARLVDDAAKIGAARLVIESDEPAVASDRRIIRDRAALAGCLDTLAYEHRRPFEECLLAIPDAAAWCWAKGGDWRRRAGPLVSQVVAV